MNDSYDGIDSGESTESSSETGSEGSAADTAKESTASAAETASAFDEKDDGVGKSNPESTESAEKGAEKGANLEVTSGTGSPGISKEEVSSAFDEDLSMKSDAQIFPDAKILPEAKKDLPAEKVELQTPESVEKNDASETVHVNCIREDLAGKEHPETGVHYETKTVAVNGKQLEVTVPECEDKYDFKLEDDQLQLDRSQHEDICNAKLKEYCDENPEWAKETFSQEQLDQIQSGKRPEGYTWHHDGGEVGHMQLVDSKIHHDTRHTGGIAIWGNKSKYI